MSTKLSKSHKIMKTLTNWFVLYFKIKCFCFGNFFYYDFIKQNEHTITNSNASFYTLMDNNTQIGNKDSDDDETSEINDISKES